MSVDRIWDFLQRLSPLTRSCLLAELERLELSGVEMPGSADIQARLRAEFRKDGGSNQNRMNQPSRFFFEPLEALLTEGAPEHANSGRIPRGSLSPIWEWINRDLLPTMARDFDAKMKDLIAADRPKEARQAASVFQTKVVKSLENMLADPGSAKASRARLGTYTAARSAYSDLIKVKCALRAREAIAKFDKALPERFAKFDGAEVAKMKARLDAFGKANAEALPFAIALLGKRLKTHWHLIRIATKGAPSKNAADVAAAPYAIAVSMVLDRIDDGRLALRMAMKQNRVLIARDLLAEIYDTEHALQVHIDRFEESEWGARLNAIMQAIADLVAAEISRFPPEVGHVLGSRLLRSHDGLAGRLTSLASKGRDAVTNGAAFCKKLIHAA
jgi:hypothetical protein